MNIPLISQELSHYINGIEYDSNIHWLYAYYIHIP